MPLERGYYSGHSISAILKYVRISVLNDNFGCSEYSTGGDGKFLFVLDPLVGHHDLFITADHQTDQSMGIIIDNVFSSNSVKFNNKPFIMSGISIFMENRQM
jgi:hypothetical protein